MVTGVVVVTAALAACASLTDEQVAGNAANSALPTLVTLINAVLPPVVAIADRIDSHTWPTGERLGQRIDDLLRDSELDANLCSIESLDSGTDDYRVGYQLRKLGSDECSDTFVATINEASNREGCFEYSVAQSGTPSLADTVCDSNLESISIPLTSLVRSASAAAADDVSEEERDALTERLRSLLAQPGR